MTDTSIDLYARIEAGNSWECCRCGRQTKQYPALSHVRDEVTGSCPSICSNCGDDEDYQQYIDGTRPTTTQHWPVRRRLESLNRERPHGIIFPAKENEKIRATGPRVGIYWEGKLEEWLSALLETGADNKSDITDLQVWSFPTRRMLDEYLSSVSGRSESDVRSLLRHLLFEACTFGFDHAQYEEIVTVQGLAPFQEQNEYSRRILKAAFNVAGYKAHPGVRWVLDLLPESPSHVGSVVESYARAHRGRMSFGRKQGLTDAIAIINTYYIGNLNNLWREALMNISPRQFEQLIARMYDEMGYDVKLTPPRRDGGRDIEATSASVGGKQRLLVECKLHRGSVGVKEARALLGVVSDERASGGVLVTTGHCTRGVRNLEEANSRLYFMDDERLVLALNSCFGSSWPDRVSWLARPI